MNERIVDDLVLKARAIAITDTEDGGKQFNLEVFYRKFAELIVQECTQLLFAESERLYTYSSECDNMHDSDEAELCAEKCMDNIQMIEEHFGVEE